MIKFKLEKEYDEREVWGLVFGSGFSTWGWWRKVQWMDGGWDEPGTVALSIEDPDCGRNEEAVIVKMLQPSDVFGAIQAMLDDGSLDAHDLEDMDADSADRVLQQAVLGSVVYA